MSIRGGSPSPAEPAALLVRPSRGDSLGANYVGIERNVLAGLHPGSIILMHENHGQRFARC
jgi:hypothetical protein